MKAKTIFAASAAVTGAYLVASAPRVFDRPDMKGLLTNYAHRGLHGDGIPENSLKAFKRAIDVGVGIELDVRESADGTLYIFHDNDLKRMCGVDKKFKETHDSEIDLLRLNGSDEHIPLFTEVLALVDGKVPLLIELKADMGDKTLCPKVASVLDEYKGLFCVESFNSFLMGWFKKNRPKIPRGQLYTDLKDPQPKLRAFADSMMINSISRPDFIAYDIEHEDKPLLRLCLKLFKPARFVWTVKSEEDFKKYSNDKKTDGIIFEGICHVKNEERSDPEKDMKGTSQN